jgi:hypothetical protein
MKLAAVNNTPVVRQAQANQAAAPAKEAEAPKESFLDKMARRDKAPVTISRVAINTLRGAVGGAICGHFIDSNKSRSVGMNAAMGAAVGGVACGAIGTAFGAFAGKPLEYGGGGLLVGAAAGGALGAAGGYVNYVLNSALPWSPAVNGAVLGAGGALIAGVYSLATQKAPTEQAAA